MGDYINLRGHEIWNLEWPNNGEAVVLLHGGLSATEDWDKYILPAVEDSFHVFAYDRTGQGRTGDQTGSLHFSFQTQEAIAYLEDTVREPAHLIGWSDGGIISLMVAIQRPDLVRSVIAIGANYHYESGGEPIALWEVSEEDRLEHAERSPDAPEALDSKVARMWKIWNTEPNLSVEDLSKITCPTLILASDDENFSFAHITSMYEAIPLGQLAIVPGTSHFLVKEKPGLVQAIIKDFLSDLTPPQTRVPVRRSKTI
jgi:pimeloyl-ACP methyl ester carboxylesterase